MRSVATMSKVWGYGTRKSNIVRTGSAWANAKHEALAIYLRGSVMPALMSPRRWGLIDVVSAGPRAIAAGRAAELPVHQTEEVRAFVAGVREVMFDTLPSYPAYLIVEPATTGSTMAESHANGVVIDGPAELVARLGKSWAERRAVLFVDPLAFELEWPTIEGLAATDAVDVWLWFPLGIGIEAWATAAWPVGWAAAVDRWVGSPDWRAAVAAVAEQGEPLEVATQRAQVLADLMLRRLAGSFAQPAPRAVVLPASSGEPLFACCFAAAASSDVVLNFRFVNTCLKRLAAVVPEAPVCADGEVARPRADRPSRASKTRRTKPPRREAE